MTKEGVGSASIEFTPFQVYVRPSLKVSVESDRTILSLLPQNNYTSEATLDILSNTTEVAMAYQCDGKPFNGTMCAISNQSQKKLPIVVGISGSDQYIDALTYSAGLTNSYVSGTQNHYYTSAVTPNAPSQTKLKVHVPSSFIAHANSGHYTGRITVHIYAIPHGNFSS